MIERTLAKKKHRWPKSFPL